MLLAGTASCALAQSQAHSTGTIIVMPFTNASGAPGLQWISEAFPAFLSERLSSDSILPLSREDRMRAYDRAGIPAEVQPSRASIYRLVEQMDVDYVILGHYTFDGRSFTATAQLPRDSELTRQRSRRRHLHFGDTSSSTILRRRTFT